jgi:hypothetical protein
MRKKHAREIRAGIRLARRYYPYDALHESAPQTFPLMTRAYDHEWERQERLRDSRAFPNVDVSLLRAFQAAFPSREARCVHLRKISDALKTGK